MQSSDPGHEWIGWLRTPRQYYAACPTTLPFPAAMAMAVITTTITSEIAR
ncbi:MAG: hypothetical protein ABFD97_06610 [Syntrophobacter sp.]